MDKSSETNPVEKTKWSEMDSEKLGDWVKRIISLIEDSTEEKETTLQYSAGLMLIDSVSKLGSTETVLDFEGVSVLGNDDIGDWKVTVSKVK